VYPKGVGGAGLARYLQEANKEVEVWLQVGGTQQARRAHTALCLQGQPSEAAEPGISSHAQVQGSRVTKPTALLGCNGTTNFMESQLRSHTASYRRSLGVQYTHRGCLPFCLPNRVSHTLTTTPAAVRFATAARLRPRAAWRPLTMFWQCQASHAHSWVGATCLQPQHPQPCCLLVSS
jgi:hypothetical protein